MQDYVVFIFSIVILSLILSSCFFVQKPAFKAPILLVPANNTITSTNVTLIWENANHSKSLEHKAFLGISSDPLVPSIVTVDTENGLIYVVNFSSNDIKCHKEKLK